MSQSPDADESQSAPSQGGVFVSVRERRGPRAVLLLADEDGPGLRASLRALDQASGSPSSERAPVHVHVFVPPGEADAHAGHH